MPAINWDNFFSDYTKIPLKSHRGDSSSTIPITVTSQMPSVMNSASLAGAILGGAH